MFSNIYVLGFYGETNSGKTHLITKIITILKIEGYKIAVIKKTTKKISIETKDKDTWKHSESGSQLVVFSTPIETSYIQKNSQDSQEIIQKILGLGSYDIILIEGANNPSIPKIKLGDIETRPNTILEYKDNFTDLITIIKKEIDKTNKEKEVKHIIQIKINGKKIPLSEFPEQIIENTILGMLSSLKEVNQIDDLEINIKK